MHLPSLVVLTYGDILAEALRLTRFFFTIFLMIPFMNKWLHLLILFTAMHHLNKQWKAVFAIRQILPPDTLMRISQPEWLALLKTIIDCLLLCLLSPDNRVLLALPFVFLYAAHLEVLDTPLQVRMLAAIQ